MFSRKEKKYDTCEKEYDTCFFLERKSNLIHMSEWYAFSEKAHLCVKEPCILMTATDCNRLQQKEGSSLRQRALYSDDCNRLQQTATDCNRKKAHLCLKEPCIPRRKSSTLPPTTSLQQTATERALQFLRRRSHFPVSDLSYLSIHASIYLCVFVCMRVCVYWCIHACMHLRVYLCIYASIYLSICKYIYIILSTHWLAAAQPLPWCSELGPYILKNNLSRSKKPHAPYLPPCALIQSVNPYINVRLLLKKSPICIGLFDKRDLAIMSMHGVVGFGYKRVWGSATLVCVSLGLSCAEPAPLSWAALLLISVSVLEQGHVERGSNVRECLHVWGFKSLTWHL